MFKIGEVDEAEHVAPAVVLRGRGAQLPFLVVAQRRYHSFFAYGFHFHAAPRIQRVGGDAVGEADDTVADGVLAQDVAVDDLVVVQVGLDPGDGRVGVEALQEVEAVAGAVEQRAGLVNDKALQCADAA